MQLNRPGQSQTLLALTGQTLYYKAVSATAQQQPRTISDTVGLTATTAKGANQQTRTVSDTVDLSGTTAVSKGASEQQLRQFQIR